MSYIKYGMMTFGPPRRNLAISSEDFVEVENARDVISDITFIEEQWDCVVQEYVDLEKSFLHNLVDHVVSSIDSYDGFQRCRLLYSRKTSNLLRACRFYLDSTARILSSLDGPDGALTACFQTERSAAYDRSFDYRFLEALRNHSQHRGVPIHGTRVSGEWIGDRERLRHTTNAFISITALREDPDFKKSVIREIGEKIQELDVLTHVRGYMDELSQIHLKVRTALSEKQQAKFVKLRNVLSRMEIPEGRQGEAKPVCVYAEREDGSTIERTVVGVHMRLLEDLQRRNGKLTNLKRRYISNELTKPRSSSM